MSIAATIRRQLRDQSQRFGSDVSFKGQTYRIFTEPVSGAQVGTQTLNTEALGALVASADPRVFKFCPEEFQPWTVIWPPMEGDLLYWHELEYLVTRVTMDDMADETLAVHCFAYRHIDKAPEAP